MKKYSSLQALENAIKKAAAAAVNSAVVIDEVKREIKA